jgi:signal transduction histidine kinase
MKLYNIFFKVFIWGLLVILTLAALGGLAGYHWLKADYPSLFENTAVIRGAVAWLVLLSATSAAFLALLVMSMFYIPFRRIVRKAREIASGETTGRLGSRHGGALNELAKAIDDMRLTLRKQLDLVAARGQDLQTVLASLHEGVIATDVGGRVVLMNPAAGTMLEVTPELALGKDLSATAPAVG